VADVRTQVYPDGAARSPGVAATGTRSTTQIIPDKPTSAPASGLWETVDVSDSRVYLASVSAAKINAAPRLVEVTQQSVSAIDQIIPVLYGYPHWLGLRLAGMVVDQYGQLLLLGALGYGELANIDGAYIDNVPAATVGTYYGTTTQTVDTQLKNAYAFRGVTFADTMRGFAYVRVTLPTSVAIQGAPNFVVKCGNKKIIDMRTGTWATGDQPSNPVLCLADYISSTVYGMGGQYNVASFSAAADFCDEGVGTGRRYRMALALTTQQKVDDWLNQITAYTGCILWRRAGVYYLTPLRARPVTLTLGKRDIVQGSLDMDLRSQRDLPTHVTVNYTDWTASPPSTRPTTQPANVPDDGRESTLQLPGIVSQEMASRIAGRRYNQIQYSQLAASWRAFDEAINYRPGDVLALSFPEYGLSGAKFAITSLVDQGFGRWSVNSESYSDAMFVDDPLPPPPSILDPGTLVPPSNVAPGLAGPVTMVEELIQFANGDFRPRLRIDWPDGTGAVSFYSIAIFDVTAGVYVETSNMPISEYISTAVDEQHVYRAYVAAVGPTGLVSAQIASADVLVLGKTAPPSDVANFVAIEAGGNVYCSWNAISDLDRDEYEIRRGTVGQAWSAMLPVSKLQATNTVLNSQPQGTVDYAIKAKDTTGHYSVTEARQTVVVTADQNLNVVGPNPFLGYTTTNCQVWTPYSTTVPVMVNTDLAGVWGDGASDPNDNTGTFNDVLKDVIIASPNAVAATMQTTPYDFGILINTRVSCTSPYTVLTGPAGGVVTTVETSTDNVTYTAIAINELRTIRYVRCRINIAAGTVIRSSQNWTVSLVAVLTTEQGSVSVGASGKATITLQSRYAAWVAIQVTPQGNTANVTATFDNVIVGTGVTNTFDVWYFKSNAPAAGTASWAFRGVR
jgi:hypothetical protein